MQEYGDMHTARAMRRILTKRAMKLAVYYAWILVNDVSVRVINKQQTRAVYPYVRSAMFSLSSLIINSDDR